MMVTKERLCFNISYFLLNLLQGKSETKVVSPVKREEIGLEELKAIKSTGGMKTSIEDINIYSTWIFINNFSVSVFLK